jgi:hypothetical protein
LLKHPNWRVLQSKQHDASEPQLELPFPQIKPAAVRLLESPQLRLVFVSSPRAVSSLDSAGEFSSGIRRTVGKKSE